MPLPITVIENHVRPSEPVPIGDYRGFRLIPFVPRRAVANIPDFDIPPGYHGLGEITFRERNAEQPVIWEYPITR